MNLARPETERAPSGCMQDAAQRRHEVAGKLRRARARARARPGARKPYRLRNFPGESPVQRRKARTKVDVVE
jgi:hypothetical protein